MVGNDAGAGQAPSLEARRDLQPKIRSRLDENLEGLLDFYRDRHGNPELSMHEAASAVAVAAQLEKVGYEVTTGVGGYGVVGVLRNGAGPTVLIRGDMDALPVTETTGLPYASTVTVDTENGGQSGVMHACGHDIHMTNLVGTAAVIASLKDRWRGTVVIIGQPAEELGMGAQAMIDDGLFTRFPRPDVCLALHVSADLPAGDVAFTTGWTTANVDTVDITIFGRGGHGARPHLAVDPIVTASQVVMAFQTLVSRRIDPVEGGVVTVGSFHAGTKHNIIPNEARLQLTVRSFSDEGRRTLLDGIRQIAVNTCRAMDSPRDPEIVVREEEFTPAGYNDPTLAAEAGAVMATVVGADHVHSVPPLTVGEDFALFPRDLGVPGLLFWLGSVDPETYAEARAKGEPLPTLHSSDFAPAPEATLRTGIEVMAMIALSMLASAG